MILGDKDKVVKKSGQFQESEFRIANNAEMFEILSSTLYSDPVAAVIRELSTNAKDAHIEAGTPDLPFNIRLPTTFDSNFVIRDYGLGLNPDKIKEVYIEYGNSDKNKSNDFVGALGLGSKSPFALADSFTVTSYSEGKRTVYTLYKDENNLPKIAKMSEEDTTEHGLEVLIPIKHKDSSLFRTKAQQILTWFPVKPTLNVKLDWFVPKNKFQEKGWLIGHGGSAFPWYLNSSYVVMGCIAYPIEQQHFKDRQVTLLQHETIIYADIGDVDISASREKMQYTNKTKKFIGDKLNEIIVKLDKMANDKISKAKSLWEAKLLATESYLDGLLCKFTWNGKKLDLNSCIDMPTSKDKDGHITYHNVRRRRYTGKFTQERWLSICKTNFFVDDGCVGPVARINHNYPKDSGTMVIINKDDLKVICDHIGINESDCIPCSSLSRPPIVKGKTRSITEKVLKYNSGKHNKQNAYWDGAEVKSDDIIHYFPIHVYSLAMKDKKLDPDTIQTITGLLVDTELLKKGTDIYGVRSAVGEKYKANWVNLLEIFEQNFDNIWQKLKLEDRISRIDLVDRMYCRSIVWHKDITSPLISSFTKKWSEVKKMTDNLNAWKEIASIAKIMGKTVKPVQDTYDDEMKEIKKKIPLLTCIADYQWGQKPVVDYINSLGI